jgi:Uma2 family endonuclease
VVLTGVSWSAYLALLGESAEHDGRFAYNEGVLEIMSPSLEHERVKRLIGRLIETLTLELGIELVSASATTFNREDLRKGLEADECYYLANADAVRHKDNIDLSIDPPPDLVVEIDISSRSMDKFPIYAALRVPEIWQYDGDVMRVFGLDNDRYAESQSSNVLPQAPLRLIAACVRQRTEKGETAIVTAFRQRIRESAS